MHRKIERKGKRETLGKSYNTTRQKAEGRRKEGQRHAIGSRGAGEKRNVPGEMSGICL
jgi:hypothetical protein